MTDKAATLKQLDDEYQNFLKAIDGLDEAQLSQTFLDVWSVKEIIAHVAGWETEMTGALGRIARGERPTPEGVDYSDSDAWNARFAASVHNVGSPTIVANWRQAHMNYVRAANGVPDDRYGVKDGKPSTVNRIIETSGYGHYREHGEHIRDWRQREGI